MVHITKHTGKMNGFESISTNNLSNPYCKLMSSIKTTICYKCYANKLCNLRPSLADKLEQNSKELSEKVLDVKDLPIVNRLYFRFNSFGELINRTHLTNLVNICKVNPRTMFTLWTKRISIVKDLEKPKNLLLIYSNPIVDNVPNINNLPNVFDKVFSVYTKEFVNEYELEINCQKRCLNCLKCYTKNKIKYISELIK